MLKRDSRYYIIGLGRTGISVLQWLQQQGITQIFAWDDNSVSRDQGKQLGATIHEDISGLRIDTCIQSPGICSDHPLVQAASAMGIPIFSDLDLFRYHHKTLPLIGITGTNGKSTTTALIHHILKSTDFDAIIGGNIGTPVLSLRADNAQVGVFELSSYQLELSRALDLEIAVWLNLQPDHLEHHKKLEAYIAAKARIFEGVQKGIVLGVDDPPLQKIWHSNPGSHVVPISVKLPLGIYAHEGRLFDQVFENNREVLHLNYPNLRGIHNHQNIAAAYTVSRLLGISVEHIDAAISSFPGLAHRQEFVRALGRVEFINDSKATNADAAARALDCFDNIYWIAGGRPKTEGIEVLTPYYHKVRKVFLIGEAQERFAKAITGLLPYECCGNMQTAVKRAFACAIDAREQGVVLLSPACASWDQYKDFEARGRDFAECVHQLDK